MTDTSETVSSKGSSSGRLMWVSTLGASFAAVGLSIFAVLVSLVWSPEQREAAESSQTQMVVTDNYDSGEGDFYAQPADLSALIEKVQRSTVTVRCKKSQGSGWVLDLGAPTDDASAADLEIDRKFPYEVITNHHVIEDCVDSPERVRARAGEEEYDAYLYSWDEENDLAIVAISQEIPNLEISTKPQPGWWAMAIGTPYGLEGSISIGNVMNTEESDIIATTPLNSGNSGGPMVNSRGQVMGTNTWVLVEDDAQDWNVAVGTPALCDVVVECGPESGFTWEN